MTYNELLTVTGHENYFSLLKYLASQGLADKGIISFKRPNRISRTLLNKEVVSPQDDANFETDYIKARAMEEILERLPTAADLVKLQIALRSDFFTWVNKLPTK